MGPASNLKRHVAQALSAPARWFPSCVELELQEAMGAGWSPDAADLYCERCGHTLRPGDSGACRSCRGKAQPWDRLVRRGPYAEPLGRWLRALKFHREWTWARWFGEGLAARVMELGPLPERCVLCPVPMPRARRWWRGYNQSTLIALAMGQRLERPVVELLYRRRYTPPQSLMAPSERLRSVSGSVGMKRVDLTGWWVWLVDDVKTTGSTLTACVHALREGGPKGVSVAVGAVADPKSQGV